MDKRTVLKDLSAADLRGELLTRLRDQLQKIEEDADEIREQIRQLIPGDAKAVDGSRRRGGSRTLIRNDQPLREVIIHVLREAGEPLRVKEIINRVRNAGYKSGASNFAGIVNVSLSSNDELFEKVERGVYKLRQTVAAAQ